MFVSVTRQHEHASYYGEFQQHVYRDINRHCEDHDVKNQYESHFPDERSLMVDVRKESREKQQEKRLYRIKDVETEDERYGYVDEKRNHHVRFPVHNNSNQKCQFLSR
jgi:hypothetical protein